MTSVRVYVNARGFDVPSTATALDAVQTADATEADAVRAGTRLITDSRGIAVAPDTAVYGGVIYRLTAHRERDTGNAS